MYNKEPMLVVQLTLAESWLQSTDADTLVGVQGTAEWEKGLCLVKHLSITEHTLLLRAAFTSHILFIVWFYLEQQQQIAIKMKCHEQQNNMQL